MKHTILILTVFLFGCNNNQQSGFTQTTTQTVDTIVGRKIITDEIAGSAYRERAIGYFVIIDKDTSDYTCIFTEYKDRGIVGIDLNIPYSKTEMTYRQRLEELKIILPKAASDFNFDSLTVMYFGRLVLSGDLAVDITKQYRQKFGTGDQLENYTTVEQFLKESKLGTDLNALLEPFSIAVDKVTIEKLILASQEELLGRNEIETDTTDVPCKILDCITSVKLTKK